MKKVVQRWRCWVESGGGRLDNAGVWESVASDKQMVFTQVDANHSQRCVANHKRIKLSIGICKHKKYDFDGNPFYEEHFSTPKDFVHLFPSVVDGSLIVREGYRIVPKSAAVPYIFEPIKETTNELEHRKR